MKKRMPSLKLDRPDKKYYLIRPCCHGNGGWCGQTVLATGTLSELFKHKVNVDEYEDAGHDPLPRICDEEDVNKAVYLWDDDTNAWDVVPPKVKVNPLVEQAIQAIWLVSYYHPNVNMSEWIKMAAELMNINTNTFGDLLEHGHSADAAFCGRPKDYKPFNL